MTTTYTLYKHTYMLNTFSPTYIDYLSSEASNTTQSLLLLSLWSMSRPQL